MKLPKLSHLLDIDKALALQAATRIWQFLSAPVTIVLITHCFTDECRGDYYTMIGISAVQNFFDLGLSSILLMFASHERVTPDDSGTENNIQGRQRLGQLYQFSIRWYRTAAVMYAVCVSVAGLAVFNTGSIFSPVWTHDLVAPWLFCVITNACSLYFVPMIVLLEGCNAVEQVNRMRFQQAVSGTLIVWGAILAGGNLWTLFLSNSVRLVWEIHLIHFQFQGFFQTLGPNSDQVLLCWRKEIWPLQWRLAIQSIGSYFSTWFMVPVVRTFQGPLAAGQVGMTWQILSNVQSVSFAWLQTRFPRFGRLVAEGRYSQLNREYWRASVRSVTVFVAATGTILGALVTCDYLGLRISSSFVGLPALLAFSAGLIGVQVAGTQQSFIRLFKKDPFLIQNLGSVLISASIFWWCARDSTVTGLATCYAVACWCYAVPLSTIVVRRHGKMIGEPSDC